jgi:hypothetical protein
MANLESVDQNVLRQRIADLEEDLRHAQAAKAEAELHAHKNAKRAHHVCPSYALHINGLNLHLSQAATNLATFGHSDTIIFVDPEERKEGLICSFSQGTGFVASICRFIVKYNIDQFVQRPVLRQWLSKGKVYREASERQSSRFELFFDLLFVGIVHQIAEAAAEEPTGIGFAKYVLTFCPAYSIWADVRDTANHFADSDAVTQRAYILWIMVLLVGYSNNANTIRWGVPVDGGNVGAWDIDAQSASATRWTLGFFVVAKLSKGSFVFLRLSPCV